ncbi:MAG: 30S ribosomal protein S27e [Nitrosopumilus sp. B06]|nr:MAG: 30S ribosomal protein S27e [Nitrosopumilus sp. D6]RNJ80236.1 MAG: 30S ribosomal protein S27e [Nitrosopumilus sp. B06]
MKKDHIEIPVPSSKFQMVKCGECSETQVVYSHASTQVACNSCGNTLAEPTGSKAKINGEILESAE